MFRVQLFRLIENFLESFFPFNRNCTRLAYPPMITCVLGRSPLDWNLVKVYKKYDRVFCFGGM